MSDEEKLPRIVGVAVRSPGGEVRSLPAPARHADLCRELARQGIASTSWAQGFVLDDGRFASRGAALYHAHRSGQVRREDQVDRLTSDHLW